MSDVWIRTEQAIELLTPRYGDNIDRMNGSVVSALVVGGFRCQARFALFQKKRPETVRNWTVPAEVWSLGGHLSLKDDRFVASTEVNEEVWQSDDPHVCGAWDIDLQNLQFHRDEFQTFYTVQPAQPDAAEAGARKTGRPIDMDKWEDFALALALTAHTAGPEAFKSRRALYGAVEGVLMSLDKSVLDEKSVRTLLDRFLANKDSEKLAG